MGTSGGQPTAKRVKFSKSETPKDFLGISAIGTISESEDWGLLSTWQTKGRDDPMLVEDDTVAEAADTRIVSSGTAWLAASDFCPEPGPSSSRVGTTRTRNSSSPLGAVVLMASLRQTFASSDVISEFSSYTASWATLALILPAILAIVIISCTFGVKIGYFLGSVGGKASLSSRAYNLSTHYGRLTHEEKTFSDGTLYDSAGNKIGHREGNCAGASVYDRLGRYIGYLAENIRGETEVILMQFGAAPVGLAPLGLTSHEMMEAWQDLEAIQSVLEVAGAAHAPPIAHQPDLMKQKVLFGPWWKEGRTYMYIYDAAGQAIGQVLADSGASTEMLVREEALKTLDKSGCLLFSMELSEGEKKKMQLTTMAKGSQPTIIGKVGLRFTYYICDQSETQQGSTTHGLNAPPGVPVAVDHVAFVVRNGGSPDILMGCRCLGRNSIIPRCVMRNDQLTTACHLEFGTLLNDSPPAQLITHHLNSTPLPDQTKIFNVEAVRRMIERVAPTTTESALEQPDAASAMELSAEDLYHDVQEIIQLMTEANKEAAGNLPEIGTGSS